MKTTIISIALLMTTNTLSYAQEQEKKTIDGLPAIEAEVADTSVVIELYENQDLPIGNGFSVFIHDWAPNDEISISAIGPKEEKVSLLLPDMHLPVDSEGDVEFSVTYSHERLYSGQWVLVVEGESGVHGHYFTVP